MKTFLALGITLAAVAVVGCSKAPGSVPTSSASAAVTSSHCWSKPPTETKGQRRLALIVGVGQYKNEEVPDLPGAPSDAKSIYEMLTGASYAFPKEDVCLLLDSDATRAEFVAAFEGLIERARASDVAVVFFAGHGSQTRDLDGDEPDGWDETLLFTDSRTGDVHDFRDDELNGLLAKLDARTKNVVLMLDSCNSGTATRGDSGLKARFFKPEESSGEAAPKSASAEDGDGGYIGASLPGLVAMTAASDGTPAVEKDGHGIFTSALIKALAQGSAEKLTYSQLARKVAPLVSAMSYQIPYFQGDLRRAVFGREDAIRPTGWEVVAAGDVVKLSGPALPGLGVGAEMRIYDGAASSAATADPTKALATVAITHFNGINAEAHRTSKGQGARALQPGDLAVLVRPADDFARLKVTLRPASAQGGIPAARALVLRGLIAKNREASKLISIVDRGGEFELSRDGENHLLLRGPENRVRNTFTDDSTVAESLWQHARQRALLQLQGEGGGSFVDGKTLQVRLVPAAKQPPCAHGEWVQAAAQEEQVIPLCHRWHVQVSLDAKAPARLLIGALILSSDGAIFALPQDAHTVLLGPGQTATFDAPNETFSGTPPLDTQDHVLVFGTQEKNPVAWNLLTQISAARGAPGGAGLQRALERYLDPGSRGASQVTETTDETTWTMSSLTMRVEANPRFLEAQSSSAPVSNREYTLKTFDLRPYLPDDKSSALYKVLEKADWLATASRSDGFSYKQHEWAGATDEANLRKGIDCSRAIWFAFTRSKLPYNNRNDAYLNTSEMVLPTSRMADRFDRCPANESPRLGDILVYRSSTRGDGHVVMVIDEGKRVAWGSHGWDGEAKAEHYAIPADTGVEYQLIKYKKDWQRWDRGDMQLKACWRYRQFAQEVTRGVGIPGMQALSRSCDTQVCIP